MRLVVLILLGLGAAACSCKGNERRADGEQANSSGADRDVRDALVLDAALAKAKKELASLESAAPRNEQAIKEKRQAIEAVEITLAHLRKRLSPQMR